MGGKLVLGVGESREVHVPLVGEFGERGKLRSSNAAPCSSVSVKECQTQGHNSLSLCMHVCTHVRMYTCTYVRMYVVD